jgi:putative DNA primase/helicase
MSDTRDYLNVIFGDTTGRAHMAVGLDPYLDENGKYKHRDWTQSHFAWPGEADLLQNEILRAAPDGDVYLCPYLMWADKRTPAAAVARRLAHADVDNGLLAANKVRGLNGFAVASGTPGNGHAYVALTESVPANWHKELCRGLGKYLGAVDAKISANDVLRPPGTWNHKPTVTGGQPAAVEWLVRP